MEVILFEQRDKVGYIRLNRPEAYHSVTRELALGMQEMLSYCARDEGIRAVVIGSSGKAFCAGQDLKEATREGSPNIEKFVTEHYNPIVRAIHFMKKPVLCAVNGVAAGAGANLALCCDIVVAKESATFIQAFSSIGLIPDSGGTYFLPRMVGYPRAKALMMLNDVITAAEAEQMGMIYKAVPDEDFDQYVDDLAKKLANGPTKTFGLIKRALDYSLENNLETQLDIEAQLQATAGMSEDFKEGVQAFLEKRKAVFLGK